MTGILGVQKEAVLAAARSIVTVEEIVDSVDESSGGAVIAASGGVVSPSQTSTTVR